MWMPLCSFRVNFGFHEKWTNEVFSGFSRQYNWCQTTVQRYKSRSAILGTFWEKIWPGPEKSKNVPKTAKIEGYNTRFRTFLGSRSERHEMPPKDMWGHWKWVMWLGTNMWMPLCSFRDNFRFHEKWTNGISEDFRDNTNGVKHPCNVTSTVRLS